MNAFIYLFDGTLKRGLPWGSPHKSSERSMTLETQCTTDAS